MTVHVNPKFMRYSCHACGQRFLLLHMLEEHRCAEKGMEEGEEDDDQHTTLNRRKA